MPTCVSQLLGLCVVGNGGGGGCGCAHTMQLSGGRVAHALL